MDVLLAVNDGLDLTLYIAQWVFCGLDDLVGAAAAVLQSPFATRVQEGIAGMAGLSLLQQ